MKSFIAVFALFAITAYVSGAVISQTQETRDNSELVRLEDVDTDGGLDKKSDDKSIRFARLTCDVFSFESGVVTPNHAACAAKCIVLGRAGGKCDNAICICREDKWVPW